jgi:hypothetical protein
MMGLKSNVKSLRTVNLEFHLGKSQHETRQAKGGQKGGGVWGFVDEIKFSSHTSGPTIFGGASIVAIISATVASGKSSIGSGTRRRFLASDGLQLPAPSGATDSVLFSPKL